jgi:ABC-type transport system substrate-binding protein
LAPKALASQPPIDTTTLYVGTIGMPETVDPAWAIDSSSKELIFNVYETLVFFDGESTDKFRPQLAKSWTLNPDDLTYTFKIRENVSFHDGSLLTPEDVEYSFERALVYASYGSPMSMLCEYLFGTSSVDELISEYGIAQTGMLIDEAVQSNGTHVWFKNPFFDQHKGHHDELPYRWRPGSVIIYKVEQQIINLGYLNVIMKSFKNWESIANIKFVYGGSFPSDNIKPEDECMKDPQYGYCVIDPKKGNNINEVRFSPATDWYGCCLPKVSGDNYEGFDIFLDENTQWSIATPCPPDKMDLESTVTHEVGHVLGLKDVDCPLETMYVRGEPGTIYKRTPFIGDMMGVMKLNLGRPLFLFSQPFGSIINKDWAVAHGDWPGWEPTYTEWVNYHNLGYSPLDLAKEMCGTGPFKLEHFSYVDRYWSIVRFSDYWGGWPALWPAPMGINPKGYLERVVVMSIEVWEARRDMFLAGDLDIIYVPRAYHQQLKSYIDEGLIRAYFPIFEIFRENPLELLCYNPNITDYSPFIGSGTLDENGIPPNFFDNEFVRMGFTYAFNYSAYITNAWLGEAMSVEYPSFNLTKAEECFRNAYFPEYGTTVWDSGFTLTIVYNEGNEARRTAAEILANGIMSLNPKFHVNIVALDWPAYIDNIQYYMLPLFFVDDHLTIDSIIPIPLAYPTIRHYERTWVQGWYYNAFYGGMLSPNEDAPIYFYPLWKQKYPKGDVNYDGIVNMRDIWYICQAFTSYPGHPKWNFRCDLDNNRIVNMRDIGEACRNFLKTDP